jgi:hypothetical protein
MTEILRIYKSNITTLIRELSSIRYQSNVWLHVMDEPGLSVSFDEAVNMLFDDSAVDYYLEQGHILFDHPSTQALRELSAAVDEVDEFRPTEEIINDPKMQIVRDKAAQALALILASDGARSTVEIVE